MSSSLLRRGRLIALLSLLGLAACTALLNTSEDQCGSDADCKKFTSTAVCQSGVCVDTATSEAGTSDGGVTLDGSTPDGSSTLPDGCTPKVPVTQSDFLNETCTNATCIPFDNCARLGLCDGGTLPALIVPDGGF